MPCRLLASMWLQEAGSWRVPEGQGWGRKSEGKGGAGLIVHLMLSGLLRLPSSAQIVQTPKAHILNTNRVPSKQTSQLPCHVVLPH